MKEEYYIRELDKEERELYDTGVHKLEIGKYEEAEKKFQKFREKVAEFPPVYNKMAVRFIYCDQFEEARKFLTQALDIDEKFAPAITNLGSIEKKEGNLDKAQSLYEKAIKINEEYGPAYNNLGVIYREKGDFRKSVKNLKKARKLGSYTVKMKSEKSFYKEKGCIIPIILFIIIALVIYFW